MIGLVRLTSKISDIAGVDPLFVGAIPIAHAILAPSIYASADIRSTLFATLKFQDGILVEVLGVNVRAQIWLN
jgi:hypothetical protein